MSTFSSFMWNGGFKTGTPMTPLLGGNGGTGTKDNEDALGGNLGLVLASDNDVNGV